MFKSSNKRITWIGPFMPWTNHLNLDVSHTRWRTWIKTEYIPIASMYVVFTYIWLIFMMPITRHHKTIRQGTVSFTIWEYHLTKILYPYRLVVSTWKNRPVKLDSISPQIGVDIEKMCWLCWNHCYLSFPGCIVSKRRSKVNPNITIKTCLFSNVMWAQSLLGIDFQVAALYESNFMSQQWPLWNSEAPKTQRLQLPGPKKGETLWYTKNK